MSDKILFVDDEQSIIDGYGRLLRKEFSIEGVLSGRDALEAMEQNGPYAVVISDMRMPEMNGAEFLAEARKRAPDTVRMLLTGYADVASAIQAVNEGNIFRYLTKPCEKETLATAIKIGTQQYHALAADRELIKQAKEKKPVASKDAAGQHEASKNTAELPGRAEARSFLESLGGDAPQCYAALFKLSLLDTIEQRYGEEAIKEYRDAVVHFLIRSLHPQDLLFNWERDVLLAVIRRQKVSSIATRIEISRIASANWDYLMHVNGRKMVIAKTLAFDLLPLSQFSSCDKLFAAFDANLIGG